MLPFASSDLQDGLKALDGSARLLVGGVAAVVAAAFSNNGSLPYGNCCLLFTIFFDVDGNQPALVIQKKEPCKYLFAACCYRFVVPINVVWR